MSDISRQLFIDKVAASLVSWLGPGLATGLITGAVPVVYHRLRGEKLTPGTGALTGAGIAGGIGPVRNLRIGIAGGNFKTAITSLPRDSARGVFSGLTALPTAYLSARAANAIADKIQG